MTLPSGTRRARVSCLAPLLLLGAACAAAACSSNAPARETTAGGASPAVESPEDGTPPGSETSGGTRQDAGESQVPPKDGGTSPPPKPEIPVVDIYDPDTIPRFELTFDAAALAILSSTNEADRDTWVHGAFKFGDVTFADVGVRRKGDTSFRALPAKAAFKVKFNKWVKKQKLWGLEEITLNNNVSDHTYLEARLAFHVFRAMGLPASRANSAEVMVNGEPYGLYTNVESPDENFLARVFGAKAKTLYEIEGGSASWQPGTAEWEIDIADPNAPVGTMPDADGLFQAVAAATDATLLADLEGHLHTQQYLRFCATEGIVGQHDGHAYGFYGSQNYFMAGDTDGKFSLVPWSLDTAFVASSGAEIDTAKPAPDDLLLARCSRNAGCWDTYKDVMRAALADFETLDLVNVAKKWHAQVDPFVQADPKRTSNYSFYESQTAKMYDWIGMRSTVIRTQMGL